jgi:hypothetical protein
MYLEVDGKRIDAKSASGLQQELDMRRLLLPQVLIIQIKQQCSYTYYSLRHLPYTVLMDITIAAKKDNVQLIVQCNGQFGCFKRRTELL